MVYRYRPLYNKVLILLEKEKKTTALIIEPDLKNAVLGIVMSTGLQKHTNTTTTCIKEEDTPILKEGDKVYFFIRDAKKFKIGDQDYYLIEDEEILVKEEE